MLILLAASESKAEVDGGEPFDLPSLSFPQLASTREAVLDALIEASGQPDALRRLGVRPSLEWLVRDNAGLREAPAVNAAAIYDGALYRAIGFDDLDAPARRRARAWVVVISALWGALRLDDRIPRYRLNLCGRLPNLDHLPQVWQPPLDEALPNVTGDGVIVDCRQAEYLSAWRPRGALAERWVALKAVRDLAGGRGAASRDAMRTQGHVVRTILAETIDPGSPEELASSLGRHFDLVLEPPPRSGAPWKLAVVTSARAAT